MYRRTLRNDLHGPLGLTAVSVVLFLLVAPGARTQQVTGPTATPASAARSARTLDLHPRDVRSLLSAQEWAALERQGRDPDEEIATAQNVSVEDFRPAPRVPDGIASIFWAARHPLQAWRLFTPVPP